MDDGTHGSLCPYLGIAQAEAAAAAQAVPEDEMGLEDPTEAYNWLE